MQKHASKDFEKKTIYEPMSNICLGKTKENLRRRGNMRSVTTEAQVETFVQRATFKNFKIISDEPALVSFSTSSVICNKLTSMGATIIYLSKLFL